MYFERLWYEPPTWRRRAVSICLAPFALLYACVIVVRNFAYDRRWLPIVKVRGALVVSVGNLVVGGAGKTPVTIFLARWARACGRRVVVLTRGYGRSSRQIVRLNSKTLPEVTVSGDEPRLIARRCPGVEVWVGYDRAALALSAADAGFDFIVLDDGFQHRRLHRDVDILIHVASQSQWLLPRGPLRDLPHSARRASILWCWDEVRSHDERVVIAGTRSRSVIDPSGKRHDASILCHQKVVLLTAIARPARVRASVERLGGLVICAFEFRDHYVFSTTELNQAMRCAEEHQGIVVTTEKDRERLPEGCNVWTLQMDVTVASGLSILASGLGLDPAFLSNDEDS